MQSRLTDILNSIVGDDIDEEMLDYMMRIKHEEDLEEFLGNIINIDNPELKEAIEEIKRIVLGTDPRYRRNRQLPQETINFEPRRSENNYLTSPPQGNKTKKIVYSPLDTYTNTPALKKGRHPCDCEARVHDLINNCLNCGRIVCEQEGSGPCFFCDNMVVTKEEQDILNSNTKESDKLYNKLIDQKKSKEWKKAIEARNKLLRADRGGEIKNTIYDDQTDYFTARSSNDRNRTPRSTAQMKLTLDLATNSLNLDADGNEFELNKGKLLLSLNKLLDDKVEAVPRQVSEENLNVQNELHGDVNNPDERNAQKTSQPPVENLLPKRIVNEGLFSQMDKGKCLSMHQPWASLLVAGIKKHEGRSWNTDHRGRLWIHAGSREPSEEEILTCEKFYREYYNDPTLTFPKKYPVSCLLGFVNVDDCLPQKEYRKKYPDGESESPYVFICSNPFILRVFLPMHGQHKIFSLGRDIHHFAKENFLASASI